jgi:hypothetical protein
MNETDSEYVFLGEGTAGRNLSIDSASMIKYVDKMNDG